MTIFVGTFTVDKVLNNTVAVAGLGFKPGAIIFFANSYPATGPVAHDYIDILSGFAVSPTNRYALSGFGNSDGARRGYGGMLDDCVIVETLIGNMYGKYDLQSFDSDGFTIVCDQAGSQLFTVAYIAFDEAADANIIEYTMPGSTGSDSFTGVGFQPEAMFCLLSNHGINSFTSQHQHGMGMADSYLNQTMNMIYCDYDASGNQTKAYRYYSGSQFVQGRLAVTSMDADGATFNVINTATWKMPILCLGGFNSPPEIIFTDNPGVVSGTTEFNEVDSDPVFEPVAMFGSATADTGDVSGAADAHRCIYAATSTTNRYTAVMSQDHETGNSVIKRGCFDNEYFGTKMDDNETLYFFADDLYSVDNDGLTLICDYDRTGGSEILPVMLFDDVTLGILMVTVELASLSPDMVPVGGPVSVMMDELALAGTSPLMTLSPGEVRAIMDELYLASTLVASDPYILAGVYDRNWIRPRARGFINVPISKTTEQ